LILEHLFMDSSSTFVFCVLFSHYKCCIEYWLDFYYLFQMRNSSERTEKKKKRRD
jgi:hypothetical protein